MIITAYFEDAGVYATALSPTIKIRNIATGGLVVNAGAMVEVGDGFYRYDFTAYDYTIAYSTLCDGTALLADADRYVRGEFTYGEGSSAISGGASIVELANQALYMLGQKSIISMTEDSEAARLCNGRFVYNRDATIRSYPWNSAMARATLAQSAVTPTWEFDYKYALPTVPLCLRVLKIEENYSWKIEGRFLLTDASTCNILYLARITDVNEMEFLLREAIAARLAADICFALTGSSTQQDKMWNLYEQKIRQAKSVDAQEGTPESLIDDTFIDSRF
jgi:hypothetical protein